MLKSFCITGMALLLLLSVPFFSAAKEPDGFELDIGRYYMSVTPKILEDGIQNDFMIGLFYTEALKMGGEIRLRFVSGAANDTVFDIEDSQVTRERQVYEVFLLPVNYRFFRISGFTLRAGAGLYYEYNDLKEKGYFNDVTLFGDPDRPDTFNAYSNDFTGNAIGPLLDAGLSFRSKYFNSSFSFGLVPVFHLDRKQTFKLSPIMNPVPVHTVESKSTGGPYYFLSFDVMLDLNYISLFGTLLHNYSKLSYTAANVKGLGEWEDIKEEFDYKTTALEISLLINLDKIMSKSSDKKNDLMLQIGYGRTFDEVTGNGNYLLFGVKKLMF